MKPHTISRRSFLAMTGVAIPLALGAQTAAPADPAAAPITPLPPGPKRLPLGLEMYSVRTSLMADVPKTVKAVADQGYDIMEFYAPYEMWTFPQAKLVRSIMDDHGVRCLSTHNHIESFTPGDGMSKAIELCQILGVKYMVMATAPDDVSGGTNMRAFPNANTIDDWKRLCGQLTTAVATLQTHGMTAGYHNHQAEWSKPRDGGDQRIVEILAANTPKEFLMQLDVGTCVEVGGDPVAWIKSNPGRIHVMHCKEWGKAKGYASVFGEGDSPWKDIFAAAESVGGIEYYLIEQEQYPPGLNDMATSALDIANWRKMRPEYKQPLDWKTLDPS